MTTPIEERMARLEGAVEQMDRRLTNIEQELRALRSELNTRFYQLFALMFGMWVTAILAIILRT
jgi:tetrahydromethanopterin S-methyltransferase subunit B